MYFDLIQINKRVKGAIIGLMVGYLIVIVLAVILSGNPLAVVNKALSLLSSSRSLTYIIQIWGPIGLSALGLTLCYRARFITIAVEGQILLSMVTTLWLLAYLIPEANSILGVLLAIILSGVIGGVVGLIPVYLRIYFNANEILVTLMLNLSIATIISEIVSSHLRVGAHVITKSIPDQFRLSWISVPLIMLIAFILVWVIDSKTSLGLSAKIYGSSRKTALTYGVDELSLFAKLSLLSGVLAGIGGSLAMLVFQYFLSANLPVGYGYSGVLAAWLSGFNPLTALGSSLLLSYMRVWAYSIMAEGVPEGFVLGSQTIVVICSLLGSYLASREGE